MTATAIVLVILSAVLHVTWNYFGKQRSPTVSYFLVANALGAVFLGPLLLTAGHEFWKDMARLLPFLLLTGVCQGSYLAFLAMAYRVGDFSLVYPFTRSLAPVFVFLILVCLGRATAGGMALVGVAMVVLGSLLLPLRHFRGLAWRRYFTSACGFGMLAALGTTGYTLLDSYCLSVLRERTPSPWSALYYAPLEALSTTLFLSGLLLFSRHRRRELVAVLRAFDGRLVLMGVGIQSGYALILIAMAFVSDVTYVAAFRQLSVPFGAAAGMLWLNEPRHNVKVWGVAVCFLGLILVALN